MKGRTRNPPLESDLTVVLCHVGNMRFGGLWSWMQLNQLEQKHAPLKADRRVKTSPAISEPQETETRIQGLSRLVQVYPDLPALEILLAP